MEPVAGIAAETLLRAAAGIDTKLSEASRSAVDDAKHYGVLIEAASQAIVALEQEYIGILREAAILRPDGEDEKRRLKSRIDAYIHGEVLRPRLRSAVSGLQAGRSALVDHAERLLIWPSARLAREQAIAQYDRLLGDLQQYLGSLGEYTGPSAIGLEDLLELRRMMDDEPEEVILAHVNVLLMGLDKSVLFDITSKCSRTLEALRLAFR